MNREKQKELERGHREGSGGKRILPGLVLAAFAAALVTYAVLINLEKNILSAYEKADCWVLAETLDKGTELTADNIGSLFRQEQVDVRHIPRGR